MGVSEGAIEAPSQPEPLSLLGRLRRFSGGHYWPGGYGDQPYIQLLEFHTVIEAELEFKNMVAINLEMRAEAASANSPDTPTP